MQDRQYLNLQLTGDDLETECKRFALMAAGIDSVFEEVNSVWLAQQLEQENEQEEI